MADLVSTKKVKHARKIHQCDYCNGKIEIGESYTLDNIKGEGELYQWKSHEYCLRVASELQTSGYFVDDGDGMSAEDFQECIKELYEEFFWTYLFDFQYLIQFKAKELAKLLKTHKLVAIRPNGYTTGWKMVEIKKEDPV